MSTAMVDAAPRAADELVARARRWIADPALAERVVPLPALVAAVDAELAKLPGRAHDHFRLRMLATQAVRAGHRRTPVACLALASGEYAILAAGDEDITHVYSSLDERELAAVEIVYP